jgi:hypothetical protein|tara:strand:+ start:504 stop:800 length:297 start_codon:yes stop_codon:yes gene_type:complete
MQNNSDFNNTFMSSDDCIDMYKQLCNKEDDPLFLISLLVNFLLLMTTGISELMASSKCKYNSLFELIISPCRKAIKEHKKNKDQIEEDLTLDKGSGIV